MKSSLEKLPELRQGLEILELQHQQLPGVLPVTSLRVSLNTGKFSAGEIVVGSISSARYVVSDYDAESYDNPYDVNEEIETEADDILDFTESNPFGTY